MTALDEMLGKVGETVNNTGLVGGRRRRVKHSKNQKSCS